VRAWNWRKIAYFGALVLDLPLLVWGVSVFPVFLAIIWIAASRTTRIRAWIDAGASSS